MKKYSLIIGLILLVTYMNCGGENHAPIISSLTFNPANPLVGQDVTCTVTASDEDDDALTFSWSAGDGTFSSTSGESVIWTAPASAGDYTITVIAMDEGDLADTLSDTITVRAVASVYGENTTHYNITSLQLTVSPIDISGAPTGAVVDSVKLIIDLFHQSAGQLDISLFTPDGDTLLLYDNNFPLTGIDTLTTTAVAGGQINGTWELHIFDDFVMEEGHLNSWNITIYYLE
jgi:hypothetical protein